MTAGEYADYLRSPWWKARRKVALERAGYACERCNQEATPRHKLEVHHLSYARLGAELDADLETNCYWCHRERQQRSA